jgi:hypothetical protein
MHAVGGRCGGAVAADNRESGYSRKIGHCQRRVRVEVVRLDEALKKIPTHLGRLIGALRRAGEGMLREVR